MSDYVTYQGRIEPLDWGRNTYTILRLPEQVVAALGNPRRVEGEVNDHPVNLAVTRAPVIGDAFLYTGRDFLTRAEIAVGEEVEVRLRPADPDAVDLPDDVADALRRTGLMQDWSALTSGKRRGLLVPVDQAKRPVTRVARITRLVAQVRGAQ